MSRHSFVMVILASLFLIGAGNNPGVPQQRCIDVLADIPEPLQSLNLATGFQPTRESAALAAAFRSHLIKAGEQGSSSLPIPIYPEIHQMWDTLSKRGLKLAGGAVSESQYTIAPDMHPGLLRINVDVLHSDPREVLYHALYGATLLDKMRQARQKDPKTLEKLFASLDPTFTKYRPLGKMTLNRSSMEVQALTVLKEKRNLLARLAFYKQHRAEPNFILNTEMEELAILPAESPRLRAALIDNIAKHYNLDKRLVELLWNTEVAFWDSE